MSLLTDESLMPKCAVLRCDHAQSLYPTILRAKVGQIEVDVKLHLCRVHQDLADRQGTIDLTTVSTT